MLTVLHLEVLKHMKLLLLTVHLECYSEKSLNAVEPEAVVCSRYLQPMEPERCNRKTTVLCIGVGEVIATHLCC